MLPEHADIQERAIRADIYMSELLNK